MHGNVPFGVASARELAAASCHESFGAATSCQESLIGHNSGNILPPEKWFMRIAHTLWGDGENKPAKWLHFFTNFPERTCRSAANGDTDPSGAMLYVLLRGDAGRDVLRGIMDGSTAQWWIDLQLRERVGIAAINASKGQ